jgi:hypothetical protein
VPTTLTRRLKTGSFPFIKWGNPADGHEGPRTPPFNWWAPVRSHDPEVETKASTRTRTSGSTTTSPAR